LPINRNQSLQPFCNNKALGLYYSAPCITVVTILYLQLQDMAG